jgi:hypothetical protein
MTERILSMRELNRAMLARQFLLERTSVPLVAVVERMGGLQTQYSPSGYLGLWTRMRTFARADLTRAMERHRVVTGTLMRVTIHTVSARDYPLFAEGVRGARRAWWLRLHRAQLRGIDMKSVGGRVRAFLADGPLRRTELAERLRAEGLPDAAWSGAGLWVDLVRVPPSGTWERRSADLYGLAETWLPPSDTTERDGLVHLARRYLGGFGPAPISDIARWAGVPPTAMRAAVEGLRLRRFRDERGAELLDLPGAPLPEGDVEAPVRFLPTWDAMVLVHARRTGVVPEPVRPRVFNTKSPQSVSTFLAGGEVAGTWRHDGDRVVVEPFAPLPRSIRRELDDEAERLAELYAESPSRLHSTQREVQGRASRRSSGMDRPHRSQRP